MSFKSDRESVFCYMRKGKNCFFYFVTRAVGNLATRLSYCNYSVVVSAHFDTKFVEFAI
jgi:hypothetical protein